MNFIFQCIVSSRICMPNTKRLNEGSRNHKQAINHRAAPLAGRGLEEGADSVSQNLSPKAQEGGTCVQCPRTEKDGYLSSDRESNEFFAF